MTSSLRDSFCSSPWFHIRINPGGDYVPCRWDFSTLTSEYNVRNTSISEYMNSETMRNLRLSILNGQETKICASCRNEDQYNKISGRKRQLLKSAIDLNNFDKTLCASPHWDWFDYSSMNQGHTNQLPVDLQIDLGNTCNSSCIMCYPIYSSRLATDYEKLHKVDPILFSYDVPKSNWADDPLLVDKFVNELAEIPNIRYLHFLGGETLYLRSFYDICNRLIESGLSKEISIGTTTNCTVYTPELERIIQEFKHVSLGLSVEVMHPVNDYVRWPSRIDIVKQNIQKFLTLREQGNLQLSLRITPFNLTASHLDTTFEFMIENSIIAESCNLLVTPSCLRLEVLPTDLREQSLEKINKVITKYQLTDSTNLLINRRNETIRTQVINNVIFEYKRLLENLKTPADVKQERYNLVRFLKGFESLHKNNILEYLPEYEEFLRRYGY